MSKGNINYKYLRRRRKNWFLRNWKALLAWAVLITAVAALVTLIAFKVVGIVNKSPNEIGGTKSPDKEIVWIDDKEPENAADKVNYTHPAEEGFPYFIKVNRAANCVTVYGIDDKNEYTVPVKAFVCSCGRQGEETIVGENYTTTDKYVWRLMNDDTYGHYAFRINKGYLFHSVPYYTAHNNDLEAEEYNKLGSFASMGCVRMCVRDVKWIYDNCPAGTLVTIYDDANNPGPLGKPEAIKIPTDSEFSGWDPTDPNEDNPWKAFSAKINGAEDITTKVGEKVDLKANVTATDTCGNDITDKIITIGRYTFDKEGQYDITYKVTDAIGSIDEVKITLTVTK